MKKVFVLLLSVVLCTFTLLIPISATSEDQPVVTLFDGTADNWLDNHGGDYLSVDTLDGKTALIHQEDNTAISLKRKFDVDLSKYNLENLYIIADIYVSQPINSGADGTLKIKNGDGADPDNTSENNQFNFTMTELGLKTGWNHLELPLSKAVPDGGDNYKIADWFCIWLNNNTDNITIAISALSIVNRVEVKETAAAETAAAETTANETAVSTETAPQTYDFTAAAAIVMAVAATVAIFNKKR